MAKIDSFEMLLNNELRDILDAENRIIKALPKLIKAADSEELQQALSDHLVETEAQVDRLEKCFRLLEGPAKAKPCQGMRGILAEGEEHVKEEYINPMLRDAVIIASAQKVEHYEIGAYGSAAAHAKLLGHNDVASLLAASMEEEKAADEKLSRLAESFVNPEAAVESGERGRVRSFRSTPAPARRNSRTTRRARTASPPYRE